MARNTKIQFRRGTESEWTISGASLAPGELGYEVDTGRFKIGQSGISLWSMLPYAGGSTLLSSTGIGFIFNESANAYNLYSYITGINGGQDGITFQTFPLSGLLNNTNASGTYYRIGLSTKLENFHNLNTNGIVVQSGNNFFGRSLSSENNINITNANGIDGNPTIGLSSALINVNSITASGTNPIVSGFNINSPSGNFTNGLTINNTSVVLASRNINTATGITGGGNLGSDLSLGLTGQAQKFHELNAQGFIVRDGSSNIVTRGLDAGSNINITNSSGISVNPSISLKPVLTDIDYIIATGTGTHSSFQYLDVSNLYISDNIDIALTAAIIARGPVLFEGNQFIVNGSGIFTSGLFVGPSGSPTGVSLVGHTHVSNDITDFCDGVAECVSTAFVASTGIQLNYNGSDTLSIALSGQAFELHKFNQNGILVRTAQDTFAARTISASGSNILVGSGNGVDGNPIIGLNPNLSVTSINTTNSVTVGQNLTIQGNLVVNGDTVTTNVETIVIEDPSIKLGQPSGNFNPSDVKDRGIEFVYPTGVNATAVTGFFGYDYSADAFVFLDHATNNNGVYSGIASTINVGGIYSSGPISGTILTSTVSSPTAPIAVSSTGLVNNLNSDLLDGQHGSYYRNWGSLTGIPQPTYSVTLTGNVTGSASATVGVGSEVSLSINTTLVGGVALGDETTGQYAKTISVNGTGLSVTSPNSSGTEYTITSNATPSNVTGTIIARDNNGNFFANQINVSSISGNINIPHPTGATNPTPTYGSTSISGTMGSLGNPDTYLFNFVIDGGTP